MRLGFFMMPVHPPHRTFTETLEEDTEKSLLADRLGFEELWLGEHFSATTEPIPSPMMFMAGLVPRTKNLRFGTGVICIPNHDPRVVAAEVAQFDHMSRGRFMLGVGPGGLLSDFELFDHTDVAVRNRKVMEAVGIMQRIWSQDPPYEIDGEFWKFSLKTNVIAELGIGYMPKPFQKGGPPVSLSLASPNSSSARTAAQQGWGIISANIIPTYSVGVALVDLQQSLRGARQKAVRRELAGGAQHHGRAERRRSARPRLRRKIVQPLFLDLYPRRARRRRAVEHPQAAAGHDG